MTLFTRPDPRSARYGYKSFAENSSSEIETVGSSLCESTSEAPRPGKCFKHPMQPFDCIASRNADASSRARSFESPKAREWSPFVYEARLESITSTTGAKFI